MAAHSSPGHPLHTDEDALRSGDLRIPMARDGGEDWFEILLVAFAVLTIVTLAVWFRAMMYGPPVLG
jgi:hypothetical protein